MECKNCKCHLNPGMDFCPNCGARVELIERTNTVAFRKTKLSNSLLFKKNSRLIKFLIIGIVALVVVVLIYSVSKMFILRDAAEESKSNNIVNYSSSVNGTYVDNLGNYPGSTLCCSPIVGNHDELYEACDKGIYKLKNKESNFDSNNSSQLVCSVNASCLSLYDGTLFFIDIKENKIKYVENAKYAENASSNNLFSPSNNAKIINFAICNGSVYSVLSQEGVFEIISFPVDYKGGNVTSLGSYSGNNIYFACFANSLRFCVINGTNWLVYKYEYGNDSSCQKVSSGSGNISCALFDDKQNFIYSEPKKNSSKVFIVDASGNRKEFNIDNKIEKMIINSSTIFAYGDNKYFWMSSDSFMTTDISDVFSSEDSSFKNLLIYNDNFGVVYKNDSVITYNINKKESSSYDTFS